MTGTASSIDACAKAVEKVFGPCNINKHEFTCVGVKHRKLANGDVTLDQDAYIATHRPIASPGLSGRPAAEEASKKVADAFVSLRGALAYTALTQAWILVYIVALQRVQKPTNLDDCKLNAVTRKLQREPQILVYLE